MARPRWRCWCPRPGRRAVVRLDLARCLLSNQRCTRRRRRRRCAGTEPRACSLLPVRPCGRRRRLRVPTVLRHPQRWPLRRTPLRAHRRRRWWWRRGYGSTRWLCLCRRGRSPRRPSTSHPIVVFAGHHVASGFGSNATRPAARRRTDLHASADRTSAERADPARPAQSIRLPPRRPCRRQVPPPTGAESTPTRRKDKRDTPIRLRQRTHPLQGVLALSAVGVPAWTGEPIPHHECWGADGE